MEAIALVFVVMYIFLAELPRHADPDHRGADRSAWHFRRAVGAFHYSINTLTMLAMVLAVGLLVDDAIVGGRERRPG